MAEEALRIVKFFGTVMFCKTSEINGGTAFESIRTAGMKIGAAWAEDFT
jgi:hypothetical protein